MAALTVRVSRLSGHACEVQAAAEWTVADLRRAAEAELGGASLGCYKEGALVITYTILGVPHYSYKESKKGP